LSDARYQVLEMLLMELCQQMQSHKLWSERTPSASALQSSQPFCVDTLSFEQWIQFIMLPRFQQMIEQRLPLPEQCDILPMAQEMWKQDHLAVQNCIEKIDILITK